MAHRLTGTWMARFPATGFASVPRYQWKACVWSTRSKARSPAIACQEKWTWANTGPQPGKRRATRDLITVDFRKWGAKIVGRTPRVRAGPPGPALRNRINLIQRVGRGGPAADQGIRPTINAGCPSM